MRKEGKEARTMKVFNTPVVEIEKFKVEDVLTTSAKDPDELPEDRG